MIRAASLLAVLLTVPAGAALADGGRLVIQSTTSTQNSGLYDVLLPLFEAESGYETRVVAVGTGQAIKNAANCDGDILIVHAREAEEAFVASGFGTERHDLMSNDFVLVGPDADPAALREAGSLTEALTRLAQARFLSRGDDSGTHLAELALWDRAGIAPDALSGRQESGQGMGATLNMAVAMEAYTLTDRATWIAFGNKRAHTVLFENDPALLNRYGVVPVSPDHCPRANAAAAKALADWLTGPAGQAAIGAYRVNGQQMFTPAAAPSEG